MRISEWSSEVCSSDLPASRMRTAPASSWALKPCSSVLDDRARVAHSRGRNNKSSQSPKGLRQFLDPDQQDAWLEGRAEWADAGERQDSIEQRMKYALRFQKLLDRKSVG